MHLSRSQRLTDWSDEDGTSMVELVVGMAMGMVVLAGLSMLLIVTLRGNARVDARTEASDNARVTMTRIMEELHSACVSPTVAPVKSTSTGYKLIFTRGTYGQETKASQAAITTELAYSPPEEVLRENTLTSGEERILLSNVRPGASGKIFEYENGTVTDGSPFLKGESPEKALGTNASSTILVKVAFKASPKSEPVSDAGAATEIQNSATLRLTPPEYSENKVAKPCM